MSNDSTRKPDPLSPDSILDLLKPSPLADICKLSPLAEQVARACKLSPFDKLFESERLAAAQMQRTLESLQAELKRREHATTPAVAPIPPAEPIPPEPNAKPTKRRRDDALTHAIRAAIAVLSPSGGALPRPHELFDYLACKDATKTVTGIAKGNRVLLWIDDNGNEQRLNFSALGKRLDRIQQGG